MYVHGYFACMHYMLSCTTCVVCSTWKGQKRAADNLGLERLSAQVLEMNSGPLGKKVTVLSC